jgi:hypothetical protein
MRGKLVLVGVEDLDVLVGVAIGLQVHVEHVGLDPEDAEMHNRVDLAIGRSLAALESCGHRAPVSVGVN